MKYSSRLILLIASMALPNILLGLVSLLEENYGFAWFFMCAGLVGLIATTLVWQQLISSFAGQSYTIDSIKRFNFDIFSHIVSYVPSLIAFGLGSNVEIYALAIFYVFYIFIIAMSDIVVLNPLLHLFGWRFRGAVLRFENGTEEVVVITRPNSQLFLGNVLLKELSDFGMYLLDE